LTVPAVLSGLSAENSKPHPVTGAVVVLTVGHLDH
jgi:hypothetical protein